MRAFSLIATGALLTIATQPAESAAHTILKKPFQTKYGFRSVTCFACHVKGKDKDGKPLGKEVLNELGTAMKQATGDGQLTKRLEEVKKADAATRKEVHEQIQRDFLQAMEVIERQKSPNGVETWGELIEAGKIEGVTKKKPKGS